MSEHELRAGLGLTHQTTGKAKVSAADMDGRRPMELFMCSLVKRTGYGDGFLWLAKHF
jgi:GTP-binding protein SAR1